MPVDEVNDEYVRSLMGNGHTAVPVHNCYSDVAFSCRHVEGAGSTQNQVHQLVVQKRRALDKDQHAPTSPPLLLERTATALPAVEATTSAGLLLGVAAEPSRDETPSASPLATSCQALPAMAAEGSTWSSMTYPV
jgi:hypothetical protein